MKKYIFWLNELNKNSIPVAGGKGANLAEMYNNKLPVPNAFVVSADTYWEFIVKADIKDDMENLLKDLDVNNTKQLNDRTAQIRRLIVNSKIPDEIAQAIKDAYLALEAGGPDRVAQVGLNFLRTSTEKPFTAVRSSATAEDLPEASFAGQQETYLNVKGTSNIIEAIRMCWASLFTARSTFYREKNNYPHMKVKIAVIIQKMVDSEKSGVAFTADPLTGEEKITIEAGWGLGEMVVSGKITPNNYVVDYNTLQILKKRVGRQEMMSIRDPMTGNSIITEVAPSKKEASVLSDNEIVILSRILKKVHEHYDAPQDIEWAYDDGKFYMVQTRPVTTIGKVKESVETNGVELFSGLPASPGVVVGTVRIIEDLSKNSLEFQQGEILVTKMTDPDYVPLMQKAKAIVTDEGGMTAHAAIVSRELGIPCVVGTLKATKTLKTGQIITVNANTGKIYEGALQQTAAIEEQAIDYSNITKIETKTKIYMNLGIPDKAAEYSRLPVDGVGLMREEFIIASKLKEHPLYLVENGQSQKFVDILVEGISKTCEAFSPRPVVLRFSDFKTNEYRNMLGGDKYEPKEENPMIGWRGVARYISFSYEKAFRLECKAVRIVREKYRNLWVMLPFVRTVEEVVKVKQIMAEEGLVESYDFKIWIMAEVPSNIFLAEEFAQYCDGFSIGSNDLTQLILGVDRDSATLAEMKMYDEQNEAVKRAIIRLIEVAHEYGKTVSICGQAPSVYPDFVEFLVRNKIDSVSINPDAVMKVMQKIADAEKEEPVPYEEPVMPVPSPPPIEETPSYKVEEDDEGPIGYNYSDDESPETPKEDSEDPYNFFKN